MCGRYTDTKRDKQFLVRMGVEAEQAEFVPRYNVAPAQEAWIITAGPDGSRILRRARWGLVPSWAEDQKIGDSLVNARCETVRTKPAFRHAFRNQRCIVLADGFYEWQKVPGGKQPVFFRLKGARQFGFGGLWETWRKDGQELVSFCIVTVPPNELVSNVHDRMPLILPEAATDQWLDSETGPEVLAQTLSPYRADEMESFPVNPIVNSSRIDSPECLKPPPPVLRQSELAL